MKWQLGMCLEGIKFLKTKSYDVNWRLVFEACPSSYFPQTEHYVFKDGSALVFRQKTPNYLGPIERLTSTNRSIMPCIVGVLHPKMKTHQDATVRCSRRQIYQYRLWWTFGTSLFRDGCDWYSGFIKVGVSWLDK